MNLRYADYQRLRLALSACLALWSGLGLLHHCTAAIVAWNGGTGSWYDATNWLPNIVPSGVDDVFIGNLPGAQNQTVFIGDPGVAYQSLELTNGMTLDMNGGELVSFGPAIIQGENTRLIARPAVGLNFADFQGELDLGSGAHLQLEDNILVHLHGESVVNGTISGRGNIVVASVSPLRFQGILDPDANGGLTLRQGTGSPDPIDLDGLAGGGHLKLDTPFSTLTIEASELLDDFSGGITLAPGSILTMSIDAGWRTSFFNEIDVLGANNQAAASQIAGADAAIGGSVSIGTAEAHLRVLANTTVEDTAIFSLQDEGWIEFDGDTEVVGGAFTLAQNARLDFDGPTTVAGGEFTTVSNLSADGAVRFNVDTTWNGSVVVNGIAQQFGDATVSGPTNIQAGVLDMDGSGNTEWNVSHFLTVVAASIDSTVSNAFDGTMNVGGIFGTLNIELTGPFDKWTMSGQLDISNNLPGVATRVNGSTMRLTGELTTDGLVRIAANTEFGTGSQTTFAGAASELRMNAETLVEAGAGFVGIGTLENEASGLMTLANGAVLGQVGLVNNGLLEVGNSPGLASVDTFDNTSDGTWLVEIGGYLAGDEHDLLQVTGGDTLLDGSIEVNLIDAGGGVFLPEIGDEFTVLTSVGNVNGTFLADPVSLAAGQQYQWEVLYHPHDVTLRLANINVPEPATLLLLSIGLIVASERRR